MILNQKSADNKNVPSAASWRWGECPSAKVLSSIEMPHNWDLFHQISDFWHREMKRPPIRVATLQGGTKMFFFHQDGFRCQLLHQRFLISFLRDKKLFQVMHTMINISITLNRLSKKKMAPKFWYAFSSFKKSHCVSSALWGEVKSAPLFWSPVCPGCRSHQSRGAEGGQEER